MSIHGGGNDCTGRGAISTARERALTYYAL